MTTRVIILPQLPKPGEQRAKLAAGFGGKVFAQLTSLDDGTEVGFSSGTAGIPPSESEREYSANWQDVGVAQASPQFLEYQCSNPETRSYEVYLNAYRLPGGDVNSLEGLLSRLKKLTRRVAGKKRAYRCLWSQGEQLFTCIVESVSVPIKRLNQGGGAMQAYPVRITLKEIPGETG